MTATPGRLSGDTIVSLLADTDPYLSCDDCFDRVDEYVEKVAADPAYDDVAMRTHLAGCGACAQEAEALLQLLAADASR